jgi:hypothetical protein
LMNALAPTIRERIERLRASAQEAQARQPFPNWPDDRRAAPNDMIRSALFGVVKPLESPVRFMLPCGISLFSQASAFA